MIKDVIAKILDAEQLADGIEKDAILTAESIKNDAALRSRRLTTHPSDDAIAKAESIIKDAESEPLPPLLGSLSPSPIPPSQIDKATDFIVAQFLKWGLVR